MDGESIDMKRGLKRFLVDNSRLTKAKSTWKGPASSTANRVPLKDRKEARRRMRVVRTTMSPL